jgi:hypothetical protein
VTERVLASTTCPPPPPPAQPFAPPPPPPTSKTFTFDTLGGAVQVLDPELMLNMQYEEFGITLTFVELVKLLLHVRALALGMEKIVADANKVSTKKKDFFT